MDNSRQTRTLGSLEQARAAQKFAGGACTVGCARARRCGGETTLSTNRPGRGPHGGTEIGGPAAWGGGDAGAGRSETRHVEIKLRTASRRRVGDG